MSLRACILITQLHPYCSSQKYEETPLTGGGGTKKVPTYHHVITSMPQYSTKSMEELRYEDYAKGNKSTPINVFRFFAALSLGILPSRMLHY